MEVLKGHRRLFYRCYKCHSLLNTEDFEIDSDGDVSRQIAPCTNCLIRAASEAANEAVKELEADPEPVEEARQAYLQALRAEVEEVEAGSHPAAEAEEVEAGSHPAAEAERIAEADTE